jgi:hypothetical protein
VTISVAKYSTHLLIHSYFCCQPSFALFLPLCLRLSAFPYFKQEASWCIPFSKNASALHRSPIQRFQSVILLYSNESRRENDSVRLQRIGVCYFFSHNFSMWSQNPLAFSPCHSDSITAYWPIKIWRKSERSPNTLRTKTEPTPADILASGWEVRGGSAITNTPLRMLSAFFFLSA